MNRRMGTPKRGKMIAVAACIVCVLCLLYGGMRWIEKRWIAKQEANAEDKGDSKELQKLIWGDISLYGTDYRYPLSYETYLLIGTDASGNEDAEGVEYTGNMADFLLLAIVNAQEESCSFLQLNRDTITEVQLLTQDGEAVTSENMQLCAAHWYGGSREQSCENTVDAVQKLLGGMPIDGYYALNMDEIATLNQAVGGVEVTIEDDFSQADPSLKKGETVNLSDEQARTFVQGRMSVGDGENTSRMRRQRQYMEGFFDKLQGITKEDPEFTINLYNDLVERATTNMPGSLVSDLALDLVDAEDQGVFTFEGSVEIGQHLGDGLDHTEFYLDESSVIEVMTQLYELEETKN